MDRLLAFDLLMLSWDDEKGEADWRGRLARPVGVAHQAGWRAAPGGRAPRGRPSAPVPDRADDHDVVLASLAGATGALNVLVPRGERRAAKKRAEEFRDGTGVSNAVSDAIREAQAPAAAAAGAVGASG